MFSYGDNQPNNNNLGQYQHRRESIIGGRTKKKSTSRSKQSDFPVAFYSDFDSDDIDEAPIIRLNNSKEESNETESNIQTTPRKKKRKKRQSSCGECGVNCRRYGFRIMNLIFVLFVFQTFFGILASFVLLFSSGSDIYKNTNGYERWQMSYKLRMGVVKIQNSARTLVDLMFYTLYIGRLMELDHEIEWMRLLRTAERMIISRQISSIQFIRYDDYYILYRNHLFETSKHFNTSEGLKKHFVYAVRNNSALLLSYYDLQLVDREHHHITSPTDSDWYREVQSSRKASEPCWTHAYLNEENLYSVYFAYPIYSQIPTRNLSMSEVNETIVATQPKDLVQFNGTSEDYLFGIVALEFKIQYVNTFLNTSSSLQSFIINGTGYVLARSSDSDSSIDELAREIYNTGLLNMNLSANESYIFDYKGKVVEISTVRDNYNLTWAVVTTSLERSYFSEVISTGVVSVILFIILFVLETLIVLCIVQSINQPLIDITKQMNNLISFKGLESPYKKHATVFNEIREMDENIQITQRGIFAFSKYVPHIVAKMIVSNMQEYGKIGLELEPSMTVMYCGVNNFAALAEKTETTAFIRVITEYYSSISQVIEAHYGIIDKFIEGTIMIFWNEKSFRCANHESRACKAAIECMEILEGLNTKWNNLMGIQLSISIGITCGEMLVGCLGNKSRMSFTVIGDACNIALRLQSLAPNYCAILVSGEIVERVKEEFVLYFVDLIKLRGKSNPTCVYNLVAFRSEASDLEKKLENDLLQAKELLFAGQYLQFYSVCERLADVWSDSAIVVKLFERAKRLVASEENISDSDKSDSVFL
ncbi:predicted protein [Naegleria gruberi]|uniref:Predicted protein n=1 Tax=Naegleria gruberi TaxID=5762 RepID=D2VLK9_NAEGR|nr:uncharacterized protein NAEGRDRAFT_69817 [Naegleria gruberi]EFC42327.1 predicted protein [Naegleria gruberi]|eukprot:XP_002675071.1 predicted protein [Naegleria gruberi strain NEG-M]